MNIYIVSDFHLKYTLGAEDRERQDHVLSFLRSLIGKADMLILNGDIFDLWFSWQGVIIKGYFPLLKVLSDLNEHGCRLVLIAGNHDFWFDDFFTRYLQMEVYEDHFTADIDGLKIFVAHGDRYTSNDLRYHLFRSLIRNPVIRKIAHLFHPDLALKIGKTMSRSSRSRRISSSLKLAKEKGLERFARKQLHDYDLVVLGHSHAPRMTEYANGVYVNTGDWIIHDSYLNIRNGKIKLGKYESKEKPA